VLGASIGPRLLSDKFHWLGGDQVVEGAAFGAVPNGGTVDGQLAEAVASAAARMVPLRLQAGTYSLTREVDLSGVPQIILDGAVVFDFSSAVSLSGFVQGAFLFIGGGRLTPLPALATDVMEGGRTLTFVSPPQLSANEWINIYNPTDGSYHASRPVYRSGEWAKIDGVSGREVTLHWPSDASYRAADVDLYRHPMKGIEIRGGPFTVVESAHPELKDLVGIKLKLLHGTNVSPLRTAGKSGHAEIMVTMCVDCHGRGMEAKQQRETGGGTNYGLSVANCDSCTFQGVFHGRRHGATTSGTNDIGAVPSRRLLLEGTFSRPMNGNGSIGAFACHGNVEKSEVRGTFIGGAIVAGGNRMIYRGEVVTPAIGIYGGELSGLDHDFSGMHIRSLGDPALVSRGVVDFGGNGGAIDSRTSRGGTINLSEVELDAPLARSIIRIRNRGYVGDDPIILDIRGMKVTRSAASSFDVRAVSGDEIAVLLTDGASREGWRVNGATEVRGRLVVEASVSLVSGA